MSKPFILFLFLMSTRIFYLDIKQGRTLHSYIVLCMLIASSLLMVEDIFGVPQKIIGYLIMLCCFPIVVLSLRRFYLIKQGKLEADQKLTNDQFHRLLIDVLIGIVLSVVAVKLFNYY